MTDEELKIPIPKGEFREIGAALIVSVFCAGYVLISIWLEASLGPDSEWTYILNKSRTTAVFGFILSWAVVFMNSVVPQDLFSLEGDNAKAILLAALFYALSQVWIYG